MRHHKRVESLMLFVELAEQLNFSQAAETLGISRSYLSEQIKRLEEDFKVPLFIRSTRNVRLTPEGQQVYQQALEIRRRSYALAREVSGVQGEVSGLIRLTAPKMFCEAVLLTLCEQFRQRHPDIRFEIHSSYRPFNLSQSEVDLAFRATTQPPENMVAVHLMDYQHWLVATPDYLAQYGTPTHIDALKTHQCLTTLHQRHWPLNSADIEVDGWLASNDNRALRMLALSGKGIVRIASYFVQEDVDNGRLVQVLADESPQHSNAIYMLHPQLIYPPAKLKAFIAYVKEALLAK